MNSQHCAQWGAFDLQCGNGVSWIDITDNKGYCEACASKLPMAVKKDLRHIYYGEPYLMEGAR